MSDSSTLLYAYGVVRADFDVSGCPAGVEDRAPELLRAGGDFAALVTRVPRDRYAPEIIERNSGEMEWITPRALAHDRVLTWAQEHGGIIPMPMFSMWGGDRALAASLGERDAELRRTVERVGGADEFGLRIHRLDQQMEAAIAGLDPAIAQLRRDAEAASTGQRYLLERKIAEESKRAVRAASQRIAREVFTALQPLSREAIIRPLTPAAAPADATLVLNAAFLVDRARYEDFRAELGARMQENQPRGLAFEFTGPWPPYNFVA